MKTSNFRIETGSLGYQIVTDTFLCGRVDVRQPFNVAIW